MQLLVSVSSAVEASAALAGGADIIDAKDPMAGALGAVTPEVLRQICAAVGGARPVSAALGDAIDESEVSGRAREFAAAGARFVKVGFAGVGSVDRAISLMTAALDGARTAGRCGVIGVAYADADRAAALPAAVLIEAAERAGAKGVLLDTADKSGPGLRALVAPRALAEWVADARARGLLVALAGKLTAGDLAFARDAGADIVGVRGAACCGSRTSRVSEDKVRGLQAVCHNAVPADAPDQTRSVGGLRPSVISSWV